MNSAVGFKGRLRWLYSFNSFWLVVPSKAGEAGSFSASSRRPHPQRCSGGCGIWPAAIKRDTRFNRKASLMKKHVVNIKATCLPFFHWEEWNCVFLWHMGNGSFTIPVLANEERWLTRTSSKIRVRMKLCIGIICFLYSHFVFHNLI